MRRASLRGTLRTQSRCATRTVRSPGEHQLDLATAHLCVLHNSLNYGTPFLWRNGGPYPHDQRPSGAPRRNGHGWLYPIRPYPCLERTRPEGSNKTVQHMMIASVARARYTKKTMIPRILAGSACGFILMNRRASKSDAHKTTHNSGHDTPQE